MFQEILGSLINNDEAAGCPLTCYTVCPNSCVGCVSRIQPTVEVRSAERIDILAIVRDEV